MPHPARRSFVRLPLGVAAACAWVGALRAAPERPEYRRESLLTRPPFSRTGPPAAGTTGGGPELHGILASHAGAEVSLTDPATRRGAWVRVGETLGAWRVESADAGAGTAVVSVDGVRLTLRLPREIRPDGVGNDGLVVIDYRQRGPDTRGEWGRLPAARQQAFREALRRHIAHAKVEHPEYFDGGTLAPEAEERRRAAMAELTARARTEAQMGEP